MHAQATDRFVALSDSWIYNLELEREDAGTKVLDKKVSHCCNSR